MKKQKIAFILLLIGIPGCFSSEAQPGVRRSGQAAVGDRPSVVTAESRPLTPRDGAEATGAFTLLSPDETGVTFQARCESDHPLARLYHSVFAAGGIAVADVDRDGRLDLFFANGPHPNKLYRQVGRLRFEDATSEAGLKDENPWSVGASFVDIDNDGDQDLYVCNYNQPNQLWINDGDGRFSERAKEYGVDLVSASVLGYFADFNNDGFLDLYLLTNRLYYEGGLVKEFSVSQGPSGEFLLEPKLQDYFKLESHGGTFTIRERGQSDHLLFNVAGKKFEDVSSPHGIADDAHGLSAVVWDFDADGDQDIYVCNDFNDADILYRNRGDGTFENVTTQVFKHTSWFSMGSDTADVNNDGLSDLFTVDMSGTSHYLSKILMGDMSAQKYFLDTAEPRQYMRNFLHLNAGLVADDKGRQPCFLEVAQICGVASTDWSWAPVFADFDGDGYVDLFVTNGHIRNFNDPDVFGRQDTIEGRTMWEVFRDEAPMLQPNIAFRNNGRLHFDDVAPQWQLDHNGISYAAAAVDLDDDGDRDLVVMNLDEPVSIYRNDLSDAHRLTVQLIGRTSNRDAIGATVSIESEVGSQQRVVMPYRGFLASQGTLVHFGLGDSDQVHAIDVRWPSGRVTHQKDVAANQLVVIVEPEDDIEVAVDASEPPPPPMFRTVAMDAIRPHHEIDYNDFYDQPLLPNRLSQLGPGVSVVDVDGDGRQDFWVAAPAGRTPEVNLVREANVETVRLPGDADEEEMSALFLDFDGDGDRDAYIVTGGVEYGTVKELIQDRLLVNRGEASFELAGEMAMPAVPVSGSCVTAADFDRDGDLDLFIGGRLVEGAYPLAPRSLLLVNETEEVDHLKFRLATDTEFPSTDLGMVTGALWSDYDNDGWCDLLVTTEWGPIHVLHNESGSLRDVTAESGLLPHTGWWNGIHGRDLDNDGDIDYVATNFGLNTKYKASPDHPIRIYYGRFGDSNEPQIIEAKVAEDGLLPVRGKSCSQQAMPFIREKFPTYHQFASSTLTSIYDQDELASAQMFEVTQLNSCILWNQQGQFEIEPLPWLAQISPGFGVLATEVNGDPFADIYMVQNFFTAQRETGRMAGGLSALMLGQGHRIFHAQWPGQSGLVVRGDAMGLAQADLNGDARPDFIVGVNDEPLEVFHNNTRENQIVVVRLEGDAKNRCAIGACVTATLSNGIQQTAEVFAGGSYLSQSPPELFFGVPDGESLATISVRWPDGSRTVESQVSSSGQVIIKKPVDSDRR